MLLGKRYTAAQLGCPVIALKKLQLAGFITDFGAWGTPQATGKENTAIQWSIDMDLEALRDLLSLSNIHTTVDHLKTWSLYDLVKTRECAANNFFWVAEHILKNPEAPDCLKQLIEKTLGK